MTKNNQELADSLRGDTEPKIPIRKGEYQPKPIPSCSICKHPCNLGYWYNVCITIYNKLRIKGIPVNGFAASRRAELIAKGELDEEPIDEEPIDE